MKIEVYNPTDRTISLTFDTQYDLCMTFVRLQEFYESSSKKFRNKYFELEDYIDWWSKNHNGVFDYVKRWKGFNISSKIFDKWSDLYFKHLRKKERVLESIICDNITNHYNGMGSFYIIAFCKETGINKEVKEHEIAHAFYYLYDSYKKEVNDALKLFKNKYRKIYNQNVQAILNNGYNKAVLLDELQAYIISKNLGLIVPNEIYGKIIGSFKKTSNKYVLSKEGQDKHVRIE